MVVSAPGVASGSTYTLTVGSETETVEMIDIIYGTGSEMGGGMGGGSAVARRRSKRWSGEAHPAQGGAGRHGKRHRGAGYQPECYQRLISGIPPPSS